MKKDSLYEAPQPIDIYKLYPGVMICYANFVQHSIIGDKFYPILRIIPTIGQSKQSDHCSIHFEHLEFIKCNVDYLDSMKIELRRLDVDLIEFNNEQRVVLNIVIKNPICKRPVASRLQTKTGRLQTKTSRLQACCNIYFFHCKFVFSVSGGAKKGSGNGNCLKFRLPAQM